MADQTFYWMIQPYLGPAIGWTLIALALYGFYRLIRKYFPRS